MKFYTEEDMRKAWNTAYTDALAIDEPDYKPSFYDDFIQSVTPISLPSDEDIINMADDYSDTDFKNPLDFLEGAKWMRNKILNK